MGRTENQRRWRANTTQQRIEVYLPDNRVTELDTLAAGRGTSRAKLIAALIAQEIARETTRSEPSTQMDAVSSRSGLERDRPAAAPPAEPETTARSDGNTTPSWSFRRPRAAAEKRYTWIAEVSDGTRIGLGADPARFYRWQGLILDGSIYLREAKGNRREDVVTKLLAVYR